MPWLWQCCQFDCLLLPAESPDLIKAQLALSGASLHLKHDLDAALQLQVWQLNTHPCCYGRKLTALACTACKMQDIQHLASVMAVFHIQLCMQEFVVQARTFIAALYTYRSTAKTHFQVLDHTPHCVCGIGNTSHLGQMECRV